MTYRYRSNLMIATTLLAMVAFVVATPAQAADAPQLSLGMAGHRETNPHDYRGIQRAE